MVIWLEFGGYKGGVFPCTVECASKGKRQIMLHHIRESPQKRKLLLAGEEMCKTDKLKQERFGFLQVEVCGIYSQWDKQPDVALVEKFQQFHFSKRLYNIVRYLPQSNWLTMATRAISMAIVLPTKAAISAARMFSDWLRVSRKLCHQTGMALLPTVTSPTSVMITRKQCWIGQKLKI